MNTPSGVAFVGAGFISYLHLFAIRSNPNVRLVALASRSRDIAENRGRIFNADPYTFDNMGTMLGRKDIDIVCVLSPNSLHAEHALAAIKAGKHIVIEKPMTVTLADADAIVKAAESAGVGIGYAENQVFAPVLMKGRELVEQGAIGKVKSVVGFCGHGGPSKAGWFWKPQFSGGGANIDLGPHTLESALYLAGKPAIKRVKSSQITEAPEGGIDVKAEFVLESDNGIEFTITSSWLEEDDNFYYEVFGEKGSIKCVFAPVPQFVTLFPEQGEPEDIEFPGRFDMHLDKYVASMGYVGQLEHFEKCFRTGAIPSESGTDGRTVLRILGAAYLSAAKQAPVELSSIPSDKTPIQLWLGN
ncbi:MAG: gfo/Idh/MocA family oxidoreductase [Candidatus Abyssobacteria bacterium SURF_17]|jgi:predicted dehydrogenase|uniref:Gfo/Idh/MocA family oxidoreductase n=1 Tax=Candidatus Abyssobacteria bacterium SURF_17 TaxID=2093361 RepID=A0A419F4Z0_9BACT|nr:MAG: gfo/Idh/MocA family oxidoreductase [Candidatus Abyssubacteria bacterium SURF_17]